MQIIDGTLRHTTGQSSSFTYCMYGPSQKPFLDRKGGTFAGKGGNVLTCLPKMEA